MTKNIIKTLIAIYPAMALSEELFLQHKKHQTALSLDEITVTASRTPQSTKTVTGDLTIIDHEAIEKLQGGSLTDLLRLQPGVQISTNGGIGTGSSVYLRGTSENQLVVLIDGVRVGSATTGTTALENLPLALIDRIEILRSPASSLYGSDAIGGVIQIFTKRQSSGHNRVYANVGAGSYDTYTGSAGADVSYKQLTAGMQVSSYDTRGISAKKNSLLLADGDRDGYRNLSGSAYAKLEFAPGQTLNLQYFESDGHNKYDSGFSGNTLDRYQQSYGGTLSNQLTDRWTSILNYNIGLDRQFSVISAATRNSFETEQAQLSWQHNYRLDHGTITAAYDRLEQDVVTKSNSVQTLDRSRSNDAFILGYIGHYGPHNTQLSLREDHNTQFGNATTGGLGYGYQFNHQWRLSAQYGSAFRAPTFNQLYAASFGDSTLVAEKSDNVEMSLNYQKNAFQAKLTVFDNHIRNFIQTLRAGCPNGLSTCAANAGKVEIQGVTLETHFSINPYWQLSGNLTIQSPRIEATDALLARRAQRYGNLVLQYSDGPWDWSTELTASSKRDDYDRNLRLSLSGYALLNSTLAYRINPQWKLQARANNILDKDYVLAAASSTVDYNTMGANVFFSLNYQMQ